MDGWVMGTLTYIKRRKNDGKKSYVIVVSYYT